MWLLRVRRKRVGRSALWQQRRIGGALRRQAHSRAPCARRSSRSRSRTDDSSRGRPQARPTHSTPSNARAEPRGERHGFGSLFPSQRQIDDARQLGVHGAPKLRDAALDQLDLSRRAMKLFLDPRPGRGPAPSRIASLRLRRDPNIRAELRALRWVRRRWRLREDPCRRSRRAKPGTTRSTEPPWRFSISNRRLWGTAARSWRMVKAAWFDDLDRAAKRARRGRWSGRPSAYPHRTRRPSEWSRESRPHWRRRRARPRSERLRPRMRHCRMAPARG